MDNREFIGELKEISPSKLIQEDKDVRYQTFFLVLGLIFNDLKGINFIKQTLEKEYRTPGPNEITAHSGEYSGLANQANKLLVSITGEFLIFLEKYKDVWAQPKFQLLIKNIHPDEHRNWSRLVNYSSDPILSKIARVRSNITFHYDHSGTELRKGYLRSFFREAKDVVQHKKAFYMIGNKMEMTRFFFADAAAEEYLREMLTREDREAINNVIADMNSTIHSILYAYIEGLTTVRRRKS